jgi:hypothetical protein
MPNAMRRRIKNKLRKTPTILAFSTSYSTNVAEYHHRIPSHVKAHKSGSQNADEKNFFKAREN